MQRSEKRLILNPLPKEHKCRQQCPPPSYHFPCPQLVSISPRAAPGSLHGYVPCPCTAPSSCTAKDQEQPSRLSCGNTVYVAWCSLQLFIQISLLGHGPWGCPSAVHVALPMNVPWNHKPEPDTHQTYPQNHRDSTLGALLVSF